ncbi:DoxX family protein [Glycomyces buryatensis]|uniref:DoxX family protein n=1 Tax=Glycomyces buryatensis TaxID=2570927 RepID=A0A4V4HS81_9ACTN|nr:DoxX family protein [Glycomyces buryatensis]THV40766.1 DoxX family protein [Glycomyces buryatensis]
MSIAHLIVTVFAALWIGFSAYSVLSKAAWVTDPLASYGVPQSWWLWLGLAKATGALGLLVGLFVPPIGIAAAIALILYFTGAVITVLRARSYSTVVYPVLYLVPAAAALTLGALA